MKKALFAFVIAWETSGTILVPCPGSIPSVNVSTISTVSYQYMPACVEIKREINKSKEFVSKNAAEKYLKANTKKFPNGQVVEVK